MKAAEIRATFLKFFESKGHTVVASSPVVPADDPTLLFTNAGMNQFKDVFLGFDKRPYTRATTAQKCIRAGGKHNDLENVGYTARHHTFFEMLGNFSFGDYFKKDAIHYAWELLTRHFKLPPERLWVTVYAEDDEAYAIWRDQIGVPAERIVRIGDNKGARYASDNFWMMGDTGPCGPCSEIFYDHGEGIPGGPPGSPDEDGDRYIEIWNNVFMQFNRDEAGVMHPLPKPSVDTGMGLERIAAVLQHVHSNYEIDLFVHLLQAARGAVERAGAQGVDPASPSLKVIADHIRACAFTVADGVIPSNEGRGYVLRRICRRAIRHGYKLGARTPFFHSLVAPLAEEMGDAYPELRREQHRIVEVLKTEEERFFLTIAHGMEILDEELDLRNPLRSWLAAETGLSWSTRFLSSDMKSDFDGLSHGSKNPKDVGVCLLFPANSTLEASKTRICNSLQELILQKETNPFPTVKWLVVVVHHSNQDLFDAANKLADANRSSFDVRVKAVGDEDLRPYMILDGETAFKLHDTYGFPLDLTADVCRERGVSVDEAGFNAAMARQREQARAAGKFKMAAGLEYSGAPTVFHGYEDLRHDGARVTAVYVDGAPVAGARAGDDAVIVLDHTPFYAESGGQVGDQGELRNATSRFVVEDTQKIQAEVFGHHGRVVEGEIKVGDALNARVDAERRAATVRNHSATHLMHKALREVLGAHVQQKGSLVTPERTRFDFAHNAPLTPDDIRQVEDLVNAEILLNAATEARVMAIEEAQQLGAMMLFGEKYGERVRVLDIGSSRELCGGTHVRRTGDIGLFKVVAEGGVAAGVRRIEAVTGLNALRYAQGLESTVLGLSDTLKTSAHELPERVHAVLEQARGLEKEIDALKSKLASAQGDELATAAREFKGVKVLAALLPGADAKVLRETVDKLKDKLKTAAVVLASVDGQKVQLAAGVTADVVGRLKASDVVNHVAVQVGGKGGGKPDFAMAGGNNPAALEPALASLYAWAEQRLA